MNYKNLGARAVFIIRHGERLDKINHLWSSKAIRPQDTPLSNVGHKQARRLGKWLYSKIPITKPIKIFSSPFIRCIQTADNIAEQLEGLQHSGLFGTNLSEICVEPGIAEDPYYMKDLKCNTPWFLNAADLMSISQRINLDYEHIRDVEFKKNENSYDEISGNTDERLNNVIYEIINHPSIQNDGTAIIVTHAKPSVDMLKSLNPIIDNIKIPHYEDIKKNHYCGPPIQYTACTHMVRNPNNIWKLQDRSKLFSNEHDPRLKFDRRQKRIKQTKYVFDDNMYKIKEKYFLDQSKYILKEYNVPHELIKNKKLGEIVKINIDEYNVSFKMPSNYNKGDNIIVRGIF